MPTKAINKQIQLLNTVMTIEEMERVEEESRKTCLEADIQVMEAAFEYKNYELSILTAKGALKIDTDNPKAKFILFWSNYRLEIINNRSALKL